MNTKNTLGMDLSHWLFVRGEGGGGGGGGGNVLEIFVLKYNWIL